MVMGIHVGSTVHGAVILCTTSLVSHLLLSYIVIDNQLNR